MSYATTAQTNISVTYDTRLRPVTYEAESSANTNDIQNRTYSYYNDGSIKQVTNAVDARFSQKNEYDFASRLKKNGVGDLAYGFAEDEYKQTLGYDAFNNLTSRQTRIKNTTDRNFTAGYTNNRKTLGGYGDGYDTLDNAGNVTYNRASSTPVDQRTWKFDAAGRMTDWLETTAYNGSTYFHDQGEG